MRDAWDRWGWAVALAACALFTLRMLWGREAFCGPETEQCAREWASATGGWVALVIGVRSLAALREQIKAAVQANENNAKIMLRRNYALAKKVESMASLVGINAKLLMDDLERQKQAIVVISPSRQQVFDKLNMLADMVQNGGFDRFEEEIEFPSPYSAEFIRRSIGHLNISLQPLGEVALTAQIRANVQLFCAACVKYGEVCQEAAIRFIREADEMRGAAHALASRNGTS